MSKRPPRFIFASSRVRKVFSGVRKVFGGVRKVDCETRKGIYEGVSTKIGIRIADTCAK